MYDTIEGGVGYAEKIFEVFDEAVRLAWKPEGVREEDLSQHLSNARASKPSKPAQVVRYYLSHEDRQDLRDDNHPGRSAHGGA